jgi:hypothetical protein
VLLYSLPLWRMQWQRHPLNPARSCQIPFYFWDIRHQQGASQRQVLAVRTPRRRQQGWWGLRSNTECK